jgi:hypothetical protein
MRWARADSESIRNGRRDCVEISSCKSFFSGALLLQCVVALVNVCVCNIDKYTAMLAQMPCLSAAV